MRISAELIRFPASFDSAVPARLLMLVALDMQSSLRHGVYGVFWKNTSKFQKLENGSPENRTPYFRSFQNQKY